MKEPKILYIAPLQDFSGYATAARNYVAALDKSGCDLVTRSLHYDGGKRSGFLREEELGKRDTQNVEIVVQHTTPNETEYLPGVFNVNYFAWETDRVPNEWVEALNKMDLVLVPCDENLRAARRSGVVVPIEKVEHAFDPSTYKRKVLPYAMPGADDYFKLLSICQISEKKGLDVLLKSYLSEFGPEDRVVLILKVYFGSSDTEQHEKAVINKINEVKQSLRLSSYPPIHIVHGVSSEDAIDKLYATSDCYVLPSRGEGWGIPYFDAMGWGLPPIAVSWAGPTEFITNDCGWLIDYHMTPCTGMNHPHPFMYTAKDNWAEPHVDSLRNALRQAHQEWSVDRKKGGDTPWARRISAGKDRVYDFSHEIIGSKMKNIIMSYYESWRQANGK